VRRAARGRIRTRSARERAPDAPRILFSFAAPADAGGWRPVGDAVMGGISASEAVASGGGTLLFRGTVSFEHGGGFASIRSPAGEFELGGTRGLLLRVRDDGKT